MQGPVAIPFIPARPSPNTSNLQRGFSDGRTPTAVPVAVPQEPLPGLFPKPMHEHSGGTTQMRLKIKQQPTLRLTSPSGVYFDSQEGFGGFGLDTEKKEPKQQQPRKLRRKRATWLHKG